MKHKIKKDWDKLKKAWAVVFIQGIAGLFLAFYGRLMLGISIDTMVLILIIMIVGNYNWGEK
jgi:membrane-bound ClpP family serine protease